MIIIIIIIGYIEKRRRKNKKGKGVQKTEKERILCDNEREIEKETGIQRSKSEVNDVQAFTLQRNICALCIYISNQKYNIFVTNLKYYTSNYLDKRKM